MQFVSQADYIIVLSKGKIKYQGTFDDLKSDPEISYLFTSNHLKNDGLNDGLNNVGDDIDAGTNIDNETKVAGDSVAKAVGNAEVSCFT